MDTVAGAATGGLGSSLFAAAKTGMINNKTANFLRVVGNGVISGIGTGVSVKISDPDISSEELFERMGMAAFLAGATTLAGELLKKTPIVKYLYKTNGQANIDYNKSPSTPRGKQAIFRMIWSFLGYKGGSAAYTVGSSYIARRANNLYGDYMENREEKE